MISLLGISTVHGNASINDTTQNALSLLTAMSASDIPVYKGSSKGIYREAVHADSIHGASGLDGTDLLPKPTVSARDEPAVDAIAKALLATEPGTSWIIATGSMTNIGLLFVKYPALAEHVKGVSIMGGSIGGGFTGAVIGKPVNGSERVGNWSEWAEFNILVDPEAADILFQNPVLNKKMVMIPLDVTHLVLATSEVQELLLRGKSGSEHSTLRTMLVELLTFFTTTYKDVFGIVSPPLHDPLAVAAILDGTVGEIPFYDTKGERKNERFDVRVVTEGTHLDAKNGAQTGRTIAKLLPEDESGVKIPRGLDIKRFWSVLEDCLERADRVNKSKGIV
jgi:uridine nucleosidase